MARRMFASCKVPRAAARVGRRRQCRLLRRQSLSRRGRMSAGADFDNIIERERGLRRELSARRLTMIAIGGAIGTGLFLGSGFAISLAGPGVLVSYAIGALIALLLMGCLAEMTVAHPTSGSFGAYAEYYIGPLAGFLVRYAYWTCIVLAVGTEVTAVPPFHRLLVSPPPRRALVVGLSRAPVRGEAPRREGLLAGGELFFAGQGDGPLGFF